MMKWNLVRVSEDFFVIALGLPVPAFNGIPLDPPLRSRFQARHVMTPSYKVRLCLFSADYLNNKIIYFENYATLLGILF